MSKLKIRRKSRAESGKALYNDRKDIIRRAAGNVFLKKGFLATKLSDIAEEANMDRASLYYYVGSKQDLYEDIYSTVVGDNIQQAQIIAEENIPAPEKLAKLLTALMASFEEKYPYYYIFLQEDLRKIESMNDPKNEQWLETSKKLSKEYFSLINNVVTDGMASGEIRSILPPRLITHSLIGMLTSSSQWFRPNGIMKSKEIGAALANMVLDGLNKK
ncbi:TetR family transcriptional regulator [gamma proteobacterium BDW918]|nr:TetR family transcriptional regulator [gamma proteobacterium BDW918]